MKRVLTAVVLVPVVLAVILKAPLWLFATVTAVFAVLTAIEYLALVEAHGYRPARIMGVMAVALPFAMLAFFDRRSLVNAVLYAAVPAYLLLFPFIVLAMAMRETELRAALPKAALTIFVFPYVAVPFLCLLLVRAESDHGWFFIILLLAVVWCGDVLAYYIGKHFGHRRIAPRISPNKSLEGAIASVIASVIAAVALCAAAPSISEWLAGRSLLYSITPGLLEAPPLWVPLLIGVLTNIAAQLGDLMESAIKRGANVKDSGALLPGHGGMLDRVDALLFAAPVAAILFSLTHHYFLASPYSR